MWRLYTGRLQKFVTILAAFDACYETVQATLYATLWITKHICIM